jgi:hypothetical protein
MLSLVAHNPESLHTTADMPILVHMYKSAGLKFAREVLRKSLKILHAFCGLLCLRNYWNDMPALNPPPLF